MYKNQRSFWFTKNTESALPNVYSFSQDWIDHHPYIVIRGEKKTLEEAKRFIDDIDQGEIPYPPQFSLTEWDNILYNVKFFDFIGEMKDK